MEKVDSAKDIEVRGELNPEQEKVCSQLKDVIQKLEGCEVQAIGMTPNMVISGGKESPCVWFRVQGRSQEFRVTAAIDTFRGKKVGVVSDYSFLPYRDELEAIPFGATLGRYVLPDVQIDLEKQ